MSKTSIEWTDETWNPTTGCTKISPGCKNCYADELHTMRHQAHLRGVKVARCYHTPFTALQVHPGRLDALPMNGKPRRVFVNSMSDLFHDEVPDEFLDRVFASMALRPQHTFQILTKRPERMRKYITREHRDKIVDYQMVEAHPVISRCISEKKPWHRNLPCLAYGTDEDSESVDLPIIRWPLPNVWLGVSVETDKYLWRIEELRKTPAAVRFLSVEPLLGPIIFDTTTADFTPKWSQGIHWVIVGGESGTGARPMHPDWARSIRDQCTAAGVPVFFKQWGEWTRSTVFDPEEFGDIRFSIDGKFKELSGEFAADGDVFMDRVGVKGAGRLLDGREWNEFPEAPRV